jgi:hypothetical protein
MGDQQNCVDCGASSPATETNYTLISARHGWRLTRAERPDGTRLVEWRCPVCWQLQKARKARGSGPQRVERVQAAPPPAHAAAGADGAQGSRDGSPAQALRARLIGRPWRT